MTVRDSADFDLDRDSASRYISSIRQTGLPILSMDVQRALFRQLPNGRARDVLILSNMPLAEGRLDLLDLWTVFRWACIK